MAGISRLHSTAAADPGAPAIVFLHGFMGCADDWKETMDLLSPDFHCVALDLPGHGRTGRCHDPGAYAMDGAVRAVEETLDDRGIEKCALIGYSMGGRLALAAALHEPARYTALVMESASPGIRSAAERERRRSLDEDWARQLETDSFESFLRAWYGQPLFESLKSDPARFRRILERRRKNDPSELARSLREMGQGVQRSLWQDTPRLGVPLLLLVGAIDLRYKGIAREVVALCPGARLALVPDAGHNVHAENPRGYARVLRGFLTRRGEVRYGEDSVD